MGDSSTPMPMMTPGQMGQYNPAPTPMETAQAQMAIDAQRFEQQQQAAAAEQARLDAQKAADQQAWEASLSSGYTGAQTYGQNRLAQLGIQDDYGIMDAYQAELDMIKSTMPAGAANPGTYFSPSVWDTVYQRELSAEQDALMRGAQDFMGYGFEERAFADTADDAILQGIIDEQYAEGMANLEMQRARGTLNDAAYNYALQEMEDMRTAGLARANTMGLTVLDDYRGELAERAAGLTTQLSGWEFGDPFGLDQARAAIEGDIAKYGARMEGDILGVIGDTSFFNMNTLFGKAGSQAGAMGTNTPVLAPIGATPFEDEEERMKTQGAGRGAAMTGAF